MMAPSPPTSHRKPFRTIALSIITCLIAAVLVVVVNLSSLLTSRAPAPAASIFFANSSARARLAQQLIIAEQTPGTARRTIALSRAAIARDPTVPVALSAAGIAFGLIGENSRTRSAMLLADRLSRRVLPVQLWLIEDAVQRDDALAALHRYDVALRTSRHASAILFPILIAAVGDPQMVRPIAQLLIHKPSWRADYTSQLVGDGPLNGATELTKVLAEMGSPLPVEHASVLMLRLSRERNYKQAFAVFRANFPAAASAKALVRDTGLAHPNIALPFGWQFVDGSDLGVSPSVEQRASAQFYASSGASGEAARQLVMLPPGAYRLTARYLNADVVQGAEPRWLVVCGTNASPKLAELRLATTTAQRKLSVAFTVPDQDCPAQWIFLTAPPANSEVTVSADLVSLSIERTH